MQVAFFGKGKYGIKFYAKTKDGKNKILSYNNMGRDDSANYDEHPRWRKKPYIEYTGQQTGQMSIVIIAKASFGVDPLSVEDKLTKCREKAKAGYFYLSGKKIGKHRWVIQSVHRDYEAYGKTSGGDLVVTEMHFSVTFIEYPFKDSDKKKASNKTNKGKAKSEKQGTKPRAKKTNYTIYTVQSGDTLWSIAKDKYGEGKKYTRIFSANQDGADGTAVISDPNKISVGWKIKIPG